MFPPPLVYSPNPNSLNSHYPIYTTYGSTSTSGSVFWGIHAKTRRPWEGSSVALEISTVEIYGLSLKGDGTSGLCSNQTPTFSQERAAHVLWCKRAWISCSKLNRVLCNGEGFSPPPKSVGRLETKNVSGEVCYLVENCFWILLTS